MRSTFLSLSGAASGDFSHEVDDLFLGHSVARVGQFARILKGIVRPFTTHLFNFTEEPTVAVEILRGLRSTEHLTEILSENSIDEQTVLNFLLQSKVSLNGAVYKHLLSKEVKGVVA